MFPVALFCFFILLVQPASAQDTFAYKGEYFGNDGYKITVLGKTESIFAAPAAASFQFFSFSNAI
jgi:hypothetical protein